MNTFVACWMRRVEEFGDSRALFRLWAPRVVWSLAFVQLALGIVAMVRWLDTGNLGYLDFFCRYEGSLFLLGFACIEFLLCLIAWCAFHRGEPLRTAWFFMSLASAFRIAGLIVAKFLSGFAYGDLQVADGAARGLPAGDFQNLGLALSGPINMTLMAGGLFVALRVYRRVGLLSHLRRLDVALLSIVGVFLVSQVFEMGRWLATLQGPVPVLKMASWLIDPLVGFLLLEAILIRRSVLNMGGGLIGRCWGAYTAAIFLTSVGDIGIWAVNSGLPWQIVYPNSFVWFLASIAYALAPAYQVEAIIRARRS